MNNKVFTISKLILTQTFRNMLPEKFKYNKVCRAHLHDFTFYMSL